MRITDVFLDAARPEISPNGQQIAFQGYDNENGGYFHVVLVNPDGTGVRRLTEGNYDYREPAWSRDGTQGRVCDRPPDGHAASSAGRRRARAATTSGRWTSHTGALKLWADTITAEEGEPTWSPDGTEIAYVVANRIEAVNEAGALRTIIPTVAGRTINSPSWAPTGTDIAYIGSGGNDADLWVGNRQITTGQDVFRFSRPQWVSATELMYAADGKIRIIDINTTAFRDVPFTATLEMPDLTWKTKKYDFDNQRPQQILGIVTPALSPDGKKVVFQALNDLWVMEIGKKPEAHHRRLVLRSRPGVVARWPLSRVFVGQGGHRGHLHPRHDQQHRASADIAERRGGRRRRGRRTGSESPSRTRRSRR